jgi:hypothetical protein
MTEKIEFSTVDEILDDLLKILPLDFQGKIKEISVKDFCFVQPPIIFFQL